VKPDWRGVRPSADEIPAGLRNQIRRIIAEELRQAFRK
jgi:hypothetical protein